jgi:hypothetical protein
MLRKNSLLKNGSNHVNDRRQEVGENQNQPNGGLPEILKYECRDQEWCLPVEAEGFAYRDYCDGEGDNVSLRCSARSEGDRMLKGRQRFYGGAGSSSEMYKEGSDSRIRCLIIGNQ